MTASPKVKRRPADPSTRIFGFWLGDDPMDDARKRGWDSFPRTGLEPTLVTPAMLPDWVVRDHPLHPAWELLTPRHRSDYLRPYFMYHHGGGYADIREQTGSWLRAVDHLHSSRRLMGTGYREVRGNIVRLQDRVLDGNIYVHSRAVPRFAAKLVTDAMHRFHSLMIGNHACYFKSRTLYARLWLREVERRLDLLLPALQRNPLRDMSGRQGELTSEGSTYPVPRPFLMDDVNGPLALAFSWALSRRLPAPKVEG